MKTFTYTLCDALGIHARPAGMIAKEAAKYSCTVQLQCEENTADAKKVFSVLGLEAHCGDTLQVSCSGEDEDTAARQLEALFHQHL